MTQVLDTQTTEALNAHAEAYAHERALVLLRIVVRGSKAKPVIEVILDGPRLVAVEDCEAVSKAVAEFLDELPSISKEYRLDVLSPGIDEPILHLYQYQRSMGRLVEITLSDGSNVKGHLRSVGDDSISVERKKNTKKSDSEAIEHILIANITKAHTLVDFNPSP